MGMAVTTGRRRRSPRGSRGSGAIWRRSEGG
uniref:Uncharacterized protein n=1 Tax=Arundo donax TaxID=35708 RepID=A0A0A9GFP9_ARUDO